MLLFFIVIHYVFLGVLIFYIFSKFLKNDRHGKKVMFILIISFILRLYCSIWHEAAVIELDKLARGDLIGDAPFLKLPYEWAKKLYESKGFSEVGFVENMFNEGISEHIMMKKRIQIMIFSK